MAELVKDIFYLYTVRRMGTRAVASEFTRRGHRRRGGRLWSANTVNDTLRNRRLPRHGRPPRHAR
ncbi:recombinase family protein [Dactylosporangium sp. CA-092794]|uniref:recombinase family protein n=1 Tax=Dactylosporangium sp. CA-092794 TaxID=3239929 RepID=UPI003D91FE2A